MCHVLAMVEGSDSRMAVLLSRGGPCCWDCGFMFDKVVVVVVVVMGGISGYSVFM